MIYFGNRQVGKTHTAINKLVGAYLKEKGKVQVIAPTYSEATHFADILVGIGVDKSDVVIFNNLTNVSYKYRLIEGLDTLIGDNEDTFAVVNRSTFIDRKDDRYMDYIKEYRPDGLIYLDNSILGEKELKEREVLELKERIAKLETEIKMMDNKKNYKEVI